MQSIREILARSRTIAVTDYQFGDTGKGKIVDCLASWARIIARGTGGANSGHTILANGVLSVFHLIPSGILHDIDGVVNVIGSGVAVDPRVLCEEIEMLKRRNLPCNHLQVSCDAKLTLPTHIVRDRLAESHAGRIGTTGRGIGPTYEDYVGRRGLKVNDMSNPAVLVAKVKDNVAFSNRIVGSYGQEWIKAVMERSRLGMFYDSSRIFDADAIVDQYLAYAAVLCPFMRDTDRFMQENVGKKNILLEGSQGMLLDVDHGIRPFVTSSSCTVDGLTKGVGLNRTHVDFSLGVIKGFYMTKVGEGPFPTELGGAQSATWCQDATREKEAQIYSNASVNDTEEFYQGVALRMAGNEYGATTGRPRRIGRLDLPQLRYALKWSGPDIVLTKLDVLNKCRTIKVCTHYDYQGGYYAYGNHDLSPGDIITTAIPDSQVLQNCVPVYRKFHGWEQSLEGVASLEDMPQKFKTILDFVVQETGVRPRILSTGPDRQETIFV